MKKLLTIVLISISFNAFTQSVGIGTTTPNASAMLDVSSTNKGILIPRMTKAERQAIASPADGLIVYQTSPDSIGFHYYANFIGWTFLVNGSKGWGLNGNSGITSSNFIGTINDAPLLFKVSNTQAGGIGRYGNVALGNARFNDFFNDIGTAGSTQNTAIGNAALRNYVVMHANTAVGFGAAENNLGGSANTAIGHYAMRNNKGGGYSVAIGKDALLTDTAAEQTVAIGANSLFWNVNKFGNTAVGTNSLFYNTNTSLGALSTTEGLHNTALGHSALFSNRKGSGSIAAGFNSLYSDTKADGIVAIGRAALYTNNLRENNLAIGDSALFNNSTGATGTLQATNNLAIGAKSLKNNTTGYNNVAIGKHSLLNNTVGISNIAIGTAAFVNNVGNDYNITIGDSTLYWGGIPTIPEPTLVKGVNNNIAIGHKAIHHASKSERNVAIGNYSNFDGVWADHNVSIGDSAMYENYHGDYNVAIGSKSMANGFVNWGGANVAVGYASLYNNGDNTSGPIDYRASRNVALGYYAGYNNTGLANNVYIGYASGYNNLSANKLYIESGGLDRDSTTSLIYGDFAADSLVLNAKTINKFSLNVRGSNALEIGYGTPGKQTDNGKICYGCFGDPAHWLGIVGGGTNNIGNDRVIKLWADGGLRVRGNAIPDANNFYTLGTSTQRWKEVWTNAATINSSDARLKTNIQKSSYGLNQVMQMRPVQYNWKTTPTTDKQIGFLAQDMLTIIPEAVVVPENGDPMGMKYTELIPVLVKAIQEQQKQIEELKKLIKEKK